MPPSSGDADAATEALLAGRWRRRAARQEAARRRVAKHGKAYVALAQAMLARRAAEAAAPARSPARRRRRR